MTRYGPKSSVRCVAFGLLSMFWLAPSIARAQSGCDKDAEGTVAAFIYFNPMYAPFYGDLESFVEKEPDRFGEGSAAVRCAFNLAKALRAKAFAAFDPKDIERRKAIEVQLGGTGSYQGMSTSTLFDLMADQMDRLGRGLPYLALGDTDALFTGATEEQQRQIQMELAFRDFLRSPMGAGVLQQHEQLIREAANLDFNMLMRLARSLD